MRKYIVPQSSTLTYLAGDHLGSTSLAVDASTGDVIETRYKPWGEVRYTTPSKTLPTRYTFTGQYSYVSDDATDLGAAGFGLMFYNARWYDPALGRFAQADTIVPGGLQGLDRYAYVGNNPIIYTDPSGHAQYHTGNWWGRHGSGWKQGESSTQSFSSAGEYHHTEDTDCASLDKQFYDQCVKYYFVTVEPNDSWNPGLITDIYEALDLILKAFGSNMDAMASAFGMVTIKWSADLGVNPYDGSKNLGITRGHTIFLVNEARQRTVIHEFGHVFDNQMNGKGSKGMLSRFYHRPCPDRSCVDDPWVIDNVKDTSPYGVDGGHVEDFAESFSFVVSYIETNGGASLFISRERQWYILSLIFDSVYPYAHHMGR